MIKTRGIVAISLLLGLFSSALATVRPDWKDYIDPDIFNQYVGKYLNYKFDGERFEGDIVGIETTTPEAKLTVLAKNVINDEKARWPNGTVPYEISDKFRPTENSLIKRAMRAIALLTFSCITFVPRSTEEDFVQFNRGLGCFSNIGRQGGIQVIMLTRGCLENLGDIQHEILHALGFFHEISRIDRDQFVTINWENIGKEDQKQFKKYTDASSFGMPYDYQSVMQYPFTAFAVDPELPTIVPTKRHARIGQNKNLSPLDVAKIQMAYGCGEVDPAHLDTETKQHTKSTAASVSPTDAPETSSSSPTSTRSNRKPSSTALPMPSNSMELPPSVPKDKIRFAGVQWNVQKPDETSAIKYDTKNVFLDNKGWLHLQLSQQDGEWTCAGMTSVDTFGFGRYEFHIDARLDQLDPNVVFVVSSHSAKIPGNVAVQFTQWGDDNADPARYGVSLQSVPGPAGKGLLNYRPFTFSLAGTYTTHSYNWLPDSVAFSSQHDHQYNSSALEFFSWKFLPRDASSIPKTPLPVSIKLCLNNNEAPKNGKDVELVIHSFKFYPAPVASRKRTEKIKFSSYEWTVRQSNEDGKFGSNAKWDGYNVALDSNDLLHLRLTQTNGEWLCAEASTIQKLGFGRYQFQIEAAIDKFDKNVAFVMYSHPVKEPGVAVQFSKWGKKDGNPASYGICQNTPGPVDPEMPDRFHTFPLSLTGTYTTHSYNWSADGVSFSSQHGHQDGNSNQEFFGWEYRSRDLAAIPQSPSPVYITLCLNKGNPPTDGKEVEIIVHSFVHTPNKPAANELPHVHVTATSPPPAPATPIPIVPAASRPLITQAEIPDAKSYLLYNTDPHGMVTDFDPYSYPVGVSRISGLGYGNRYNNRNSGHNYWNNGYGSNTYGTGNWRTY